MWSIAGLLIGGTLAAWKAPNDVAISGFGAFAGHLESFVEFRDSVGQILSTKTDSQGRFRIKHLGEGTYKFKTTLAGFSSVMGTVILKMHADHSDVIIIEMPIGV